MCCVISKLEITIDSTNTQFAPVVLAMFKEPYIGITEQIPQIW